MALTPYEQRLATIKAEVKKMQKEGKSKAEIAKFVGKVSQPTANAKTLKLLRDLHIRMEKASKDRLAATKKPTSRKRP